MRKAVTETAEAAVRALGIVLGPAHVELRLGPEGPVLIEVNPRLAGGWIPGWCGRRPAPT
ncbi:ATP-grasp domain-containing protein [Streptomyces sp. AD2-2]|nr:ATP-grasp domain-containing protein [Streptomyces sp. AD2-2]